MPDRWWSPDDVPGDGEILLLLGACVVGLPLLLLYAGGLFLWNGLTGKGWRVWPEENGDVA